jgi:hypothetical protein
LETIATPQKNHRNTTGKPSENHKKIIRNTKKTKGNLIGQPSQKPKENHKNTIGKP